LSDIVPFFEASSFFAGPVRSGQTDIYTDAIKKLDASFVRIIGQVKVVVDKADNLKRHASLASKDPYVLFQLGNGKLYHTKPKNFTSNPVWNKEILIDVDNKSELKLNILVMDSNLGVDEPFGNYRIDLSPEVFKHGVETPVVCNLFNTQSGTLHLKVTVTLPEATKEAETAGGAPNIGDLLASLQKKFKTILTEVITGMDAKDTIEYDTYPQGLVLPKMTKGIPFGQVMSPQKFGNMAQRGVEYSFSEINFLARLSLEEDKYMAIISGYVHPPLEVWNRWKDDKELCNQLLNGVSPMDIRTVSDISAVPSEMKELKAEGKSVADFIKEKRLFMVNHTEIDKYPRKDKMYFYAPVLLVYVDKNEELAILGIRLTNNAANNKVYTPTTTPPNRWLFAKILFQNADNQVHQFKWHLGLTHLAMEPFAIATFNTIYKKKHPIGLLLNPHFKDTIGINYMARQTLVAEQYAFTDKTFSFGTTNALQYFSDVWKAYKLKDYSFPNQLKARGFDEQRSDGLKNYYYRDDGFLIWNSLLGYIKSVVDTVYQDDDRVKNDAVLQEWVHECSAPDKGAFPGFPQIQDISTLVETLATIIFNCSAQHSAINYSQFDYLSYVPSRPDSIFKPMPDDDAEITMEYIQQALPNMIIAQFQVLFAYLLTLPQFDPLLDLPGTENAFPTQHAAMKANLKKIQEQISQRNDDLKKSGKVPYPFLEPKNIATSIAI